MLPMNVPESADAMPVHVIRQERRAVARGLRDIEPTLSFSHQH